MCQSPPATISPYTVCKTVHERYALHAMVLQQTLRKSPLHKEYTRDTPLFITMRATRGAPLKEYMRMQRECVMKRALRRRTSSPERAANIYMHYMLSEHIIVHGYMRESRYGVITPFLVVKAALRRRSANASAPALITRAGPSPSARNARRASAVTRYHSCLSAACSSIWRLLRQT